MANEERQQPEFLACHAHLTCLKCNACMGERHRSNCTQPSSYVGYADIDISRAVFGDDRTYKPMMVSLAESVPTTTTLSDAHLPTTASKRANAQ